MNTFTKEDIEELAYKAARMLGVTKKLKKIVFVPGPTSTGGFCLPESGEIRYPEWLLTSTPYANVVHFVIHEVIHLKHPCLNHQDKKFRKTEEAINRKFGMRLIFDKAYALSLHDLKGNLLWRREWLRSKKVRKMCKELDVCWKTVPETYTR